MELAPNHFFSFTNAIKEHRWKKLFEPDQEFSNARLEFYENAYHPLEEKDVFLEWYNIIHGICIPYDAQTINTYLVMSTPRLGTFFKCD